jgi:hypothetical protein
MLKAARVPFLALTVSALMLLAGCNRIADPSADQPEPIDVHSSTWAFNTDLVIGQTIQGGTVSVAMTYDYIYIKYKAVDGWWMVATQAHVALTKDSIPHSNGGMNPGQFAYKVDHDPNTQEYVYAIPMKAGWRSATQLYIATHAVAQEKDANGNPIGGQQTGWGRGPRYSQRNWGMYLVVPVPKTLRLPASLVHVQYSGVTNCGFGYSPTEYHVWDVPEGYAPGDGYFPAFCLDLGIYVYPQPYYARLWSSYDPTMPAYALYKRGTDDPVPYDKINYVLNTYGPPPYEAADAAFLQHVFWYWRGNISWGQLTEDEQAAVLDADLRGEGWIPGAGQFFAVLIDIEQTVQLCFLVLDP